MTAATALTPTLGQSARRWWFTGVVVAVVLVIGIVTLTTANRLDTSGSFSPTGAKPDGARALATVLAEQGVRVRPVARMNAATHASAGAAILVDDSAGLVSRAQWRALAAATTRLIVVRPDFTALRAVAVGVALAGSPKGTTAPAGCDTALGRRAVSMSLAQAPSTLRLTDPSAGTACFVDSAAGAQVVSTRYGSTDVVLLASAEPFENGQIGAAGNAAVALGVLGARDTLLWFTPSALDAAATGGPSLAQLTPGWVTPLVLLLLAAGVAAAFWQGRRLGPLAIERLPVQVRSRESVEGRARLYQRSGARLRAADALRIGAIGRLATMLGLSAQASVEEVARATAMATNRPMDAVLATLLTAEPASDARLIAISDDLARLERAVAATRPFAPHAPSPGVVRGPNTVPPASAPPSEPPQGAP